jgi:hypothetical protein|tara:strand:+ start:495 stop:3236 length:2742 start_codon:yes stop_codon:yes gene_type:complete
MSIESGPEKTPQSKQFNRRDFIGTTAGAVGAMALSSAIPTMAASESGKRAARYVFGNTDSLSIGSGWESLNPGYWQIKGGALRRRLKNVGDRARRTGFPFHSMTAGKKMETEYDPSLPVGILYRNDWKLKGAFEVSAKFTCRADRTEPLDGDSAEWKMFQKGYGYFGIAFGAKSIFESFGKIVQAHQVVWSDQPNLELIRARKGAGSKAAPGAVFKLKAPGLSTGDQVEIRLVVKPSSKGKSTIETILSAKGKSVRLKEEMATSATEGFVGVAGRGTIDFEVNSFNVSAIDCEQGNAGHTECLVCYPLGETLKQEDGKWTVRFVGIFDGDGTEVAIRVTDTENPKKGWASVPIAGTGAIVNNDFRRNTAVIDVRLPVSPNRKTLYYTVWKDGQNVTTDPRIGSAAVGAGTGLVGDVPKSGGYVGRLPRLAAPYKLCGLSCHAITSGLQKKTPDGYRILGGGAEWQFRDQPTEGAYQHLEDYNFQVMVWEDDVWYMELALYPPSTDDAYKVIKNSICGPASRWQCMRHWNVINPGDHDYGMDDVKGPEQIAIRTVEGLGQDTSYMKRNFQIVHHLVTGAETVDPVANPKKWRAWKMPNRDFTLAILDSRLWRSSQDVDMWDDSGWGAFKSLYDRKDPTRSLLGEEQFAWLQELIATDSSKLICLTGINGMHTVWTGAAASANHPMKFDQRDRVTADYAGWVKAGSDRVLELLGSRDGVVTVYGDVHNGSIMKNREHNVIECSFGPIGRSGGRAVIPGFGPRMKDVDGRDLEMHALYHKTHRNPQLDPQGKGDPFYWNFLEMEFDPQAEDPAIGLRVRNLIDGPEDAPRGGSALETSASNTGRKALSKLGAFNTLANADVRFATRDGRPVRGTRSGGKGQVLPVGLADIAPGEIIIATAWNGVRAKSTVLTSKKA